MQHPVDGFTQRKSTAGGAAVASDGDARAQVARARRRERLEGSLHPRADLAHVVSAGACALRAVTFDQYRIHVAEGCRPSYEARRTMDNLATLHPRLMQVIPRVDERRVSASSAHCPCPATEREAPRIHANSGARPWAFTTRPRPVRRDRRRFRRRADPGSSDPSIAVSYPAAGRTRAGCSSTPRRPR